MRWIQVHLDIRNELMVKNYVQIGQSVKRMFMGRKVDPYKRSSCIPIPS